MKYFSYFMLVVSALVLTPSRFAFAQSSPDDSLNQSEIEEETTELSDLSTGRASSYVEDELQGMPRVAKAPRVANHHRPSQLQMLQAEKAALAIAVNALGPKADYQSMKAQKIHALYQAKVARLQKEIADLRMTVATREAESAVTQERAMQDRLDLAKAKKTRDELKKQAHKAKARRVHVAYEDPFN